MASATDIAWLAGIIDGEGCLYAKQTSIHALMFRLTIESVSRRMIDKAVFVLGCLDVEHKLYGPYWRAKSTRHSWRLHVQKKFSLLRLCQAILPYSVVKGPELLLVQSYLEKGRIGPYSATEEELLIINELSALKKFA